MSKKSFFIGVAAAVAVVAIGGVAVNGIAGKKLRSALADIPGARVDFKKASVSLIGGNVELRDVDFALTDSTGVSPGVKGHVKALRLERVRWFRLLRGEADAGRLLIREPEVQLVLQGGEAPEKEDTASAQKSFLKRVSLGELRIEKGAVGLRSLKDSTKVSAQGFDFSVREIGLAFPEGALSYNDSLYRVALDSLDYMDAQGLSRILVGHMETADAGPVMAQAMHLYNCVGQEELAVRLGKVSAMWYDVQLDSLYVSPLNIPRLMGSERVVVDSISLSGPRAVILQDDRYAPAVPYATLQEGLNSVSRPLQIRKIDACLEDFTFLWEVTRKNRGVYPMKDVRLAVNSVSNVRGNVMSADLKSGHKGHSRLDMTLNIRNDKAESTWGRIQVYNLDASKMDGFLRPLFGATARAQIHKIDCNFKGDKHKMKEDFCMVYDNLKVKAWKDEYAPYRVVAKNSGAITFLANLALPNSNPLAAGRAPKRVAVEFSRDPMLPYPSYLIQNITMGALRTVLPGGRIHKLHEK
ncbi:MAG: hypothetical protein IJ152_01335 [Bacteroidales bacterium]|nr:hypothetical protein [Bacteroidales bacterium]